jgi:hypothetical protein
MNQALKKKMAQKAPSFEIASLRKSVSDAQDKLDAAVEKLKNVSQATKSG